MCYFLFLHTFSVLSAVLLTQILCSLCSVRFREDSSLFISKLGYHMIELMDHAAFILEKTHSDVKFGCLGPNSIFNSMERIVTSVKSFFGSPLFDKWEKEKGIDSGLQAAITYSIEKLLKGVAKVFDGCSEYGSDIPSAAELSDVFDRKNSRDSYSSDNSKNTIVDMELDVGAGSKDADILALGGKAASGFSSVKLKMEILSFFSAFFSVLPSVTSDILFNLVGKESNPSVCLQSSYILPYRFCTPAVFTCPSFLFGSCQNTFLLLFFISPQIYLYLHLYTNNYSFEVVISLEIFTSSILTQKREG